VPTIATRLPLRRLPVARGRLSGGRRTSTRRTPERCAACARPGTDSSGVCNPLTMSRPASTAAINSGLQCAGMRPPTGVTPITSERAPAAAAATGSSSARPRSMVPPGSRVWPMQSCALQSRRPKAVLAFSGLVSSPRNNR